MVCSKKSALLAATVGATANLIAFVADNGIGQHFGLSRLTGAFSDGRPRGAKGGVVGAGGCEKRVACQRCAAGGFGK